MAKHEGKHTEMLEKIYASLVPLMIFPFIVIAVFGDTLFPFVFGARWIEAGLISQILAFRIFVEIIFSPAFNLVNIVEKQELDLIRSIVSTLISLVSILLGVHFGNVYLAFWCIALMEGVVMILFAGYLMRLINFHFWLSMHKVSKYFFVCLTLSTALICLKMFFEPNMFSILFTIGFTTAINYILILYFDRELLNMLKGIIPSLKK